MNHRQKVAGKFMNNFHFNRRRFQHLLNGLFAAATLVLTGCDTIKTKPEHVILVDHAGNSLYTDGDKARSSEPIEPHLARLTNAIAQCTDCVAPDGTKQILIYVHGGLNSFNQSLTRANEVIPEVLADHYYPVLISWDSGFIGSYWESLTQIRQGQIKHVWGWFTVPFYLVADIGRAVTRAPVSWYYQMDNDISTIAHYETPTFSRATRANNALVKTSTTAQGLKISIGGDTRTELNKLGYFSAYVLTTPLKMVTAPFIDALGKSAWDNMERRTQTMFHSPCEFYAPDKTNQIEAAKMRVGAAPLGAVAGLMQALADLIKNDPSHRYSIMLIGHSMGTIVANEIIEAQPSLPYSNIVYMAAACSVSECQAVVIPYLERATNANFYNLTLHPVADAREAQWKYLDVTPRGSLLVWIDNFLSSPRTVPERTLGRWDNIISATTLIPKDVADRIHIKAFAVGPTPGPTENPQFHGDFSQDQFWKPAFRQRWVK